MDIDSDNEFEHDPTHRGESDAQTNILHAARDYIKRNFGIIPIAYREKRPIWRDWPNRVIRNEDELEVFDGPPLNIGIVWGTTSDGVVDVDLDTVEAVRAAHELLPATWCFGRASHPYSHRLYISPGARSVAYVDPSDNKTLVELRSDRHQTIGPPSVHPSGESVRWEDGPDQPTEIDEAVLSKLIADLSAVTLIARHWKPGSRHTLALAVSGALLRAGRTRDEVERLIRAIATAAEDDEVPDRVAAVRDAHAKLADGAQVTGWPTVIQIVGETVGSTAMKWFGIKPKSHHPSGAAGTQVEILVELASDAELFHDSQGFPFARFPVNGHYETHSIKSRGAFAEHLILLFEAKQGQPPRRDHLESAISLLGARASRGPEHPVVTRVAMEGDEIVIDPGWNEWQVIKIGPTGYRVTMDTSLRFIRSRNLGSLPPPEPGGVIDDLKPFVNVATDGDFRLLVMFLLAALRPSGTYPVLVLTGEPGSAKTTVSGYCKKLCDPARVAALRSLPRTERDIAVAARGCHVLAFTNISTLTTNQSDTICRISTGEGFGIRQLYTDGDEFLFDGARPFILNGIEDFMTRSDLQDRAIAIELANIAAGERKSLDELNAEFDAASPRIFGALLNALSAGLRNIAATKLPGLPRMADVVRWAVACSEELPWSADDLLADYAAMQAESATVAARSDDVGNAIIEWARVHAVREPFIGTATELLSELNSHTDEKIRDRRDWPSNGQRLSERLRRLAPALRKAGVSIERSRSGKQGTRMITVNCTLPDEGQRPEGGGGTHDRPDTCSKCGSREGLWWDHTHGIWVCECTIYPQDPSSRTCRRTGRRWRPVPAPSTRRCATERSTTCGGFRSATSRRGSRRSRSPGGSSPCVDSSDRGPRTSPSGRAA